VENGWGGGGPDFVVMRLDINLATHRYEDAHQFWVRWGTGLGVLAIATLALLILTISSWYDARIDHKKIADLRAQIAERDKERFEAEAMLNRPQNRAMRDKSQYLNELIARKAFSWTRAFEDMERVMPPRLHLVSLQPQLNDDNQLAIKMVVAGDSAEHAIELVKRMEESQHFRETRIDTQNAAQGGAAAGGDAVQFGINALYVSAQDSHTQAVASPAKPASLPKSGLRILKPGSGTKVDARSQR
jgi:type IV pilus assembly protein PilN